MHVLYTMYFSRRMWIKKKWHTRTSVEVVWFLCRVCWRWKESWLRSWFRWWRVPTWTACWTATATLWLTANRRWRPGCMKSCRRTRSLQMMTMRRYVANLRKWSEDLKIAWFDQAPGAMPCLPVSLQFEKLEVLFKSSPLKYFNLFKELWKYSYASLFPIGTYCPYDTVGDRTVNGWSSKCNKVSKKLNVVCLWYNKSLLPHLALIPLLISRFLQQIFHLIIVV